MDNLIRIAEDHKNEREIWVAVSTLIAVIISVVFLIRNVKIKNLFSIIIPYFCAIIIIFLGLLIYLYNRELDNTTVLYYDIEQGHKRESKPLTLLTVFYVLMFIFIVLIFISLLISFLMYKPSNEVVPQ